MAVIRDNDQVYLREERSGKVTLFLAEPMLKDLSDCGTQPHSIPGPGNCIIGAEGRLTVFFGNRYIGNFKPFIGNLPKQMQDAGCGFGLQFTPNGVYSEVQENATRAATPFS